ncbi:hypothetical protein INR49_000885 [Caranx melampygus]|nr:hypothetical protein INR49_000885 [Caranx melampygus]
MTGPFTRATAFAFPPGHRFCSVSTGPTSKGSFPTTESQHKSRNVEDREKFAVPLTLQSTKSRVAFFEEL